MIVRELLTTALQRANDTANGHTPNGRDLEHARQILNGRLKKYSSDNLISVYQKIKDCKITKEKSLVGNKFEGKKLIVDGQELATSKVYTMANKDSVDLTIDTCQYRPLYDVLFDESQEVDAFDPDFFDQSHPEGAICSPFYTIWPQNKYTVISTAKINNGHSDAFSWTRETTFKFGSHTFKPRTSGTCQAYSEHVIDIACDDYVSELDVGDHIIFQNGSTTVNDIYCYAPTSSDIERNNKHSWIHLLPEQVDNYVGFRPDVFIKDCDKIVGVNYQDERDRWHLLQFRNLMNFYVDRDDDLYNCRPQSQGLIEFLIKNKYKNNNFKLIYNGKMEFGLDDFIDLPPEYEEFLTVAVIVELLRDDEGSNSQHLIEAKEELRELTNQIMENNVSTKMLQRDNENDEEDRLDMLFRGSFLRRIR